MQRTLVILKPDAVQRKLIGRVVARFEDKGFRIAGMKLAVLPEETVRSHYVAHEGKEFYEPLVRYMSGQPLLLMVLEAKNAVAVARAMMGPTFGGDAPPGTIRGDYAVSNRFNLIHGSDSAEAAEKEIAIFFEPEEVFDAEDALEGWVYDMSTGERV